MAVWPPDDVLDLLAALPRPVTPGLRWTTRDQWHVTLRFLGAVDDVAEVATALATVDMPSVDVALGPHAGQFGHRILHVPVRGLEAVAASVVRATAHLGEPPDDRPFRGHVTLARATGRGARVDLRALAGVPIEAEWTATEMCLVESRLSPKGANYEVVRRFPRRGP